ncbi:MAG TPA: inositol monophosphatase family protein [Burkholderiaceae bacterium]|nr:inositol monophosphatase family protein [Burkholderiaceae bacterium]
MTHDNAPAAEAVTLPDPKLLKEIELSAVDLARLAGTTIEAWLGRSLAVRYKSGAEDDVSLRDPVSEVDHEVELLIRSHLADRFPGHDILGEESEERPGRDSDYVWAVDPIDGTTNFVNGFPMFAASIGVLYRCRPIAGAVWCSTTHALRAGVYHARAGGPVCFDDEMLQPRSNPQVRRHLAGEPRATQDPALPWEVRRTGSAALECAFVAAGLLRVARFAGPNVWDVAGGLALVNASGRQVLERRAGRWQPLESFHSPKGPDGAPDLRQWRGTLVLGDEDGVRLMCAALDRSAS